MSSSKIICVIGVTGNQGGSVAQRFLQDPTYHAAEIGVSCRKYAYDVELQQGKNIADAAAATVGSLDESGFIVSTLSHARKRSGGRYQELYHFDAKADVFPDYVQSNCPELARKMSCVQTGYFMSSYKLVPGAYFGRADDGSFETTFPTTADAEVPHFDVDADMGNFVYAVSKTAPGKGYIAEGTTCSWAEYMRLWSQVKSVPASYREISLEELIEKTPDAEFGREVGDMLVYSTNPGYDGGDRELLRAADIRKNWKLASNIFNRPSQIPSLSSTTNQQGGIYAPTLRYHKGTFYLIVSFLGPEVKGLIFTSSDPYSDAAWSEPLEFKVRGIDPDIFWDDDGTLYVTSADDQRIQHYSLDLKTGETGPVTYLWNGTGGVWPEGPHLYRKDDYYYLLIAEGGTELNHAATMARSKSRTGPWEVHSHNPLITNKNTTEYFQTVGHADLFQDGAGNWWAVALSTRSGPEWKNYPMGRETVLSPVTWKKGEWPVVQPVRGQMQGPLPRKDKGISRGEGGFINKPEHVTFKPGSSIPPHFLYWRYPDTSNFAVSPPGHRNTLRLTPSFYNLTGDASFTPDEAITLLTRRQTDTLFTYSVDVSLDPQVPDEEAGITVFLTQEQHIDLGLVLLKSANGSSSLSIRLRVEGRGNYEGTLPNKTVPVPEGWAEEPIRFEVRAVSDTQYEFSVASVKKPAHRSVIGYADSTIVSGDTGRFTGSLIGVYATSNGGSGTTEAYISNWRYEGQGQKIDHDVTISSE
ncbi:hypothetical protein BBP40_012161 [Aspergillus hancockii]|nr:hypothetical protein BBP40_012161 [Aspergillus hancockii]